VSVIGYQSVRESVVIGYHHEVSVIGCQSVRESVRESVVIGYHHEVSYYWLSVSERVSGDWEGDMPHIKSVVKCKNCLRRTEDRLC